MKKIVLSVLLVMMLSLTGCNEAVPEETVQTKEYFAMDTYCTATVYGDNGTGFEDIAIACASNAQKLLVPSATSNIYFASAAKQTLQLSQEAGEVIDKAYDVTKMSDGAFDITIAPLTKLWDITNRTVPPMETEVQFARDLSGSNMVTYSSDMHSFLFAASGTGLDIGAVGKGYAGDKTAAALKEAGYSGGVITLGGNVTAFGKKQDGSSFVVGIKNPLEKQTSSILGTVVAEDCSVITSGAYERNFYYEGKLYHHIIDPSTGYPAQSDLLSVTIVSKDGVYGDAFSTAAYVLGLSKGKAMLEKAVEQGKINGAVLVDKTSTVYEVGTPRFRLTNGEFNEG